MGIRLEDLPLRAQQQAMAQLRDEEERRKGKAPAANKYHNEKTDSLGIRFDSKKEARRYEALLLRLKAGEIRNLKLQRDFTLQEAYTTPEGERVRAIRYRADFSYEERDPDAERASEFGFQSTPWRPVVEDVKSRATRTREYIIKRKLMLEKYNIEIQEV